MRAFIISEFGHPGSVGERPMPEPGAGEMLVRVRAAGVNALDPMVRAGLLRDYMEHRFPLTPGNDYAGTVEAVGAGVKVEWKLEDLGDQIWSACPGFSTEAVQTPARVTVTCVTPLGEEVASIW